MLRFVVTGAVASIFALCTFVAPCAAAELPTEEGESRESVAARHDAEEVAEMRNLLDHFETESSRYRVWNAVADTTLGAASLAAGGFVLERDMAFGGFVLLARGAASVTSGVLDLTVYRAPVERLRLHFAQRAASGMSADEVVRESAEEWRVVANHVRSTRIRSGVLSLAVGTLLTGLGMAVAIGNVGLPSESVDSVDRASFASIFTGFGAVTLSSGVRSLLVEDPIEAGWKAYAIHRPNLLSSAHFTVVAVRQGVFAGLALAF
ncbi:hypothetical protein AKJ09_00549 [Labilithrix luteola]|uniref:Uncharacterized protein n=1 Tax=Labilithrix luteola TaxID=1391654 RepID=A0A0K1PK28_9BACT|nr:hypothetical protein [Labilithrix luteola]AKU93885.1 hypothetical protein AKJ09_00549 [Labilithrix luteola]